MRSRIKVYAFLILAIVALFPSCVSHKKVYNKYSLTETTQIDCVEKLLDNSGQWNNMSAKVSVKLITEKGKYRKVNVNLRVKRDEKILVSIAPLLGIEVARMEITPAGLVIIDRINKKFAECRFDDLKMKLNIDYTVLQSLFMNEAFIYGKNVLDLSDAKRFSVRYDEQYNVIEEISRRKSIRNSFYTNVHSYLLQRTTMVVNHTRYGIDWKYSDFQEVEGRLFPTNMTITPKGILQNVCAELGFIRVTANQDWNTKPFSTARYERVSLKHFLNLIQGKQ